MDIHDIYTELIMEKSNDKTHFHDLEGKHNSHRAFNASCGDDLTLHVKVVDHIIQEASFTGIGCAISKASGTMMIDLLLGKTVDEAKSIIATFISMIKKELTDDDALAILDDALYLKNISNMPARVKCAVLAWHGLEEALLSPVEI